MLVQIFNIITPIFIVAALGYLIERGTKDFPSEALSRLAMLVGTPSLVFSSLTSTPLPSETLAKVSIISATIVLLSGLLSALAIKIMRLPIRTFLPALSLPNLGNAGLPIVFFAFSDVGLTIGVSAFFVVALVQYIVVPPVVAGELNLRKVVREPLIWAVLAVVVFKVLDVQPPVIVAETTRLLGGLMIPIMLILLGGALARIKVQDIGRSVALAALRLCLGAVTGIAVIYLFDLNGVEAGTIFLLSIMPSALVTYVIAERQGRDSEQVAGLVVCSTLLTFLCLPVLVKISFYLANGETALRF